MEQERLAFLLHFPGPGSSQQLIHGISKDICAAGPITAPFSRRENRSPGRVSGSPRVLRPVKAWISNEQNMVLTTSELMEVSVFLVKPEN